MMKLLLLSLLTLFSVGLQDTVDESSQTRNASSLKLHSEDTVPNFTANISTFRRILPPAKYKKTKRQAPPSLSILDNGNLKWQPWTGSLPNEAVSIYNRYAKRVDYVCKSHCHAGFYNAALGSYCHYADKGKEHRTSSFQILVNEGNFEILEWKDGSTNSVPQNSVRTCKSIEIYVGKNEYGLGLVHHDKYFYLPWKNKEYWYSSYQALTINRDIESEQIDNVVYNTDKAQILSYPPETMRSSAVTNNECNPVSKKAELSKTYKVEKRWDIGGSFTLGLKKTFTAGIPTVASGQIEISAEISVQASGGQTVTEEISHSVSLELKVPPNQLCKVRMVVHKSKIDIPFTARVKRVYVDGRTIVTTIYGTYNSVDVGEVHAIVDRCDPVPNAEPCHKDPTQCGDTLQEYK